MKAGIYLRQSLDVSEGIERQRERCTALVAARGWDLCETYVDNDTSASKTRGQGTAWAQMLADAVTGALDVVVAVNLDRLLRTQRDLTTLIETGVKVTTLEGELDLASASGEMQASVLTAMARFEVRRKSERQKRANEQRAADGRWYGGRRPFGFLSDGMTVREDEAHALVQGFRDVVAGASLASVARSWNAAGLFGAQTRQARSGRAGEPSPWTSQSVRKVLLNPRYVGRVRYRGELMTVPAKWPALVDEPTFEAVKAILTNPGRTTRGPSPRYLLSGLAFCGVCGAHGDVVTVHAGGAARRGVRAYRCSATMGHFARKADPVDEYVTAVVTARLARPDALDLTRKRHDVDTKALHLESVGLRERLDGLAVEFADGVLTASQLRAATQRLRTRIAEIELMLADAGRVDALGDLVSAADVRAVWDALPVDRQRAAIGALMTVTLLPVGRGTRTFRPETVRIAWKGKS